MGITLHVQLRCGELHRGQTHHLLQRAHIVQAELQAVERQQRFALCVGRLQARHLQIPRQLDRVGLCCGCSGRHLCKRHTDVGVHRGGLQLHRQVGREVAQVRCQVKTGESDGAVGFAALCERGALGRRIKRAAIQRKGQARQHLHFTLGIEVAQKRHTHLQVAHFVGAAHGAVHKVHTATVQRQVVQRKPCGLAGRVGGGGGQPVDDVLDVVTATTFVGQAHTRVVHLDRVHHRGQPQQGLQLAIYIDTLNVQLVGRTIGLGNRQVTQC